jgi:serine/threonine protein phosphatase PrpC
MSSIYQTLYELTHKLFKVHNIGYQMTNPTNTKLQTRLYGWLMRKTNASAVRRVGELPIAIGSDIGNVRNENQDRVAVLKVNLELNQSFVVIALCDGMGGMAEGSACASQALASFFISCISNRSLSPSNRLSIAAQDANRVVHANYKGSGGATLSAILLDGVGGLTGVNIGDSRIYSHQEYQLDQLTVDDTLAGLRPNANNDLHPRNELLQFIGMGDGMEPHIVETSAAQKLMILTSDGAHYFDKNVMQQIIQNAKEPAMAVKRLIDVAKWCGGRDNASVAIASPLVIQPQLFDDTGFIQIWDPFGELQIIVPEATASETGQINIEPQGVKKPDDQKAADRILFPPKLLIKKRKQPKKNIMDKVVPKKGRAKTESESPELNIYFNGAAGKDGHHG